MVGFRTIGALGAAALLAFAPLANAASSRDPVISEARANAAHTHLLVTGSDLPTTSPRLTLGIGTAPLVVTLATPTRIEALLPAGIEPGTYLLWLTSPQAAGSGAGGPRGDEFWVTVGAVGPAGVPGLAGPQGAPGAAGPAGPAGATGATGPQGPAGNVGPQGPAGPQGERGPAGAEGTGRTINLTIDATQFPGIVAQDFTALFPETLVNTTRMFVNGLAAECRVVVVNGPAVEIQVVQLASDRFESGFNQELPLVVEVLPPAGGESANCAAEIEQWRDRLNAGLDSPRRISLAVEHQDGGTAFAWQLSAYVPGSIADGVEGRRVTFVHAGPPDIAADVERSAQWGTEAHYFPPGDRRVEIAGVLAGAFPAAVAETPTGVTLEYGFSEGGHIWDWVRNTMNGGSVLHASNVSVIVVDAARVEISRMNYSQCFPKRYEHFTGFGQALQAKERVFLQCNSRAPG